MSLDGGLCSWGVVGEYLSPTRCQEAFSPRYIHTEGAVLTQFWCCRLPKAHPGTRRPNSSSRWSRTRGIAGKCEKISFRFNIRSYHISLSPSVFALPRVFELRELIIGPMSGSSSSGLV
jgi:hypothetical protein